LPPLLLLPGLGADERLFAAQRDIRDIHVIPWIAARHPRERLADYAARLAHSVDADAPFDLGGASFGGMVALEIARHLKPQRVFLIGSCRSPASVAPWLRALRGVPVMRPPRFTISMLARWFGATSAEHVRLFAEMLEATPLPFLRWACGAILSWSGAAELPMPVRHIHGDHDRIIPVRSVNADRIVPGAGHLLTLTHPDAVNQFLASPCR